MTAWHTAHVVVSAVITYKYILFVFHVSDVQNLKHLLL